MSMSALTETAAPTSDLHVAEIEPLPSPAELLDQLPADDAALRRVARSREAVRAALLGIDDRLLVVVGPCSIHDTEAGLEYARQLAAVTQRLDHRLLVVMRTYFEKPRTTIGWKGLVNDPHLDGSHDIATGLHRARGFLRDVVDLGLPTATEFLEPISPQYLADLISWGAIGARTAESQIHRQLASGLSMPHSPRWYDGRLWVLESGSGRVGWINATTGQYEVLAELPGFTRGLDFCGPLAFVGLSQVRESAVFSGIAIAERPLEERCCGVWVVNIQTGQIIAHVKFEDAVQEIFAVTVLPGMRRPDVINDEPGLIADSFIVPDEALDLIPGSLRHLASKH